MKEINEQKRIQFQNLEVRETLDNVQVNHDLQADEQQQLQEGWNSSKMYLDICQLRRHL